MFNLKIIFLTLFSTVIYATSLSIDDRVKFYDLLPSSQIYIDKTRALTIDDIVKKDIKFKQNNKKLLGFGYSPDFDVWIKFTLTNTTNKNIEKIIEYDNSLTTNVKFYNPNDNYYLQQEGLFYINKKRKTINPTFKIILKSYQSKTYYIKVSSYITTLIIKLNIWDIDSFYKKEIKHQFILALFFGAMFILALYNLFIYFFTKDISYLYYVIYILGIIIHHLVYVGIAHTYILNQSSIIFMIEFSSVFVALPVFALGLFTKSFLYVKQYSILNKILNAFLILIPISIIIFITTDDYDKYRNLLTLCLLVYLMMITIYATMKKNKQAYFILFGWFVFLSSGIAMYLSSAGIFNIHQYYSYIIETAFVLEAIIFSIALANRINLLQKDKVEVNKKLILQQQNEKKRLEIQVSEKTKDLKVALNQKGLLLKELNHRVKNNMQTIVSLIRLQADEIEDYKFKNIFITVQNRINAMSHLHELLYQQDNISHVNAYAYFDILINELKESYRSEVDINFNIKIDLKMEQAIYCGLILNELITNSFKYAFPCKKGNININLVKENNKNKLYISDNGIGYIQDTESSSFGLILVKTLAVEQLRGDIKINSTSGVKVEITWGGNG